jgi:hypothetical protein
VIAFRKKDEGAETRVLGSAGGGNPEVPTGRQGDNFVSLMSRLPHELKRGSVLLGTGGVSSFELEVDSFEP